MKELPAIFRNIGPVTTASVEAVEARLLVGTLPPAACPVRHHFAPGLCVREVKMPAGALVIGHAHRIADLNIMLTGRLTLLLADGSLKELCAPQTFVSPPGRKIAYIHEDVIWQNVWATSLTDPCAVENEFLDKSPGWTANEEQLFNLAYLQAQPDRDDFAAFLQEWHLTPEMVQHISENEADQTGFTEGTHGVMVQRSPIAGQGLFATEPFGRDQIICVARTNGPQAFRTPAGRYTNHARRPNARMVKVPNGTIYLVANHNIRGCHGGLPGEEITVDYRQALRAAQQPTTQGLVCQP